VNFSPFRSVLIWFIRQVISSAGLKSMIYAGLTQDDPRVKAAIGYIKDRYTLDENPGRAGTPC
jgi:hypothetical protein